MKIQDLGELHGKILLFGGVYSNFDALTALWHWADGQGIAPENRICTGDIAAYCAEPAACVGHFMDVKTPVIAGNCEIQLSTRQEDCGCGFDESSVCNLLSRAWYAHADTQMNGQMRSFMGSLPDRIIFQHAGRRFVVIHGGAHDVSRFIWPNASADELQHEIDALAGQVGPIDTVIAGHSGIPFSKTVGKTEWINAGAIGMPAHDFATHTHFAVLNSGDLSFHKLDYDHVAAAAKMKEAGLIQGYHKTLLSGVWPSEDSLPPELHHSAASG